MSGSAMSHTNFGNCLGIYYRNFRGLRTKHLEFYDVFAFDFDIICLSETVWLNNLFYDQQPLPPAWAAAGADMI
jgi:hypothetical protein